MAWKAPQLLLAILVALVALTYQARRKTFISVQEIPASGTYVIATMQFVTSEFNKENDDKYSFRIVRVLKVKKLVTDHMEYHINLEMRRTTCQRLETENCTFQEGELYKQIECFYSVFVVPWFEKYKILKKTAPVARCLAHTNGYIEVCECILQEAHCQEKMCVLNRKEEDLGYNAQVFFPNGPIRLFLQERTD